jgi:hypothetical protein
VARGRRGGPPARRPGQGRGPLVSPWAVPQRVAQWVSAWVSQWADPWVAPLSPLLGTPHGLAAGAASFLLAVCGLLLLVGLALDLGE